VTTNSIRQRPLWRAAVAALVAALILPLAACGSDSTSDESSSNGGSGGDSSDSNLGQGDIPAPTEEGVKAGLLKVLNPDIDWESLPPEVQSVMMSPELTEDQKKVWEQCMSEPSCETGTDGYLLAYVTDIVGGYESISRGELFAYAISTGRVGRMITLESDANLQQTIANFKSAMAQGADMIVGGWSQFGNQMRSVFSEATDRGIPIINGSTNFVDEVAKEQTVVVNGDLCGMWDSAAKTLTEMAAAKGIANPTYAIFTGPAGNAYAALWQPCASESFKGLGWSEVYSGTTDWTPQGQVQAASALRASGKEPDAILYDYAVDSFIRSYRDANADTLPMMVNGGSVYVLEAKEYQAAVDAGLEPVVLQAGSDVWMSRMQLAFSLSYLNDSLSTESFVYSRLPADLSKLMPVFDLGMDNFAILGSFLNAEQENFALEH
jgi:hypothetical protein